MTCEHVQLPAGGAASERSCCWRCGADHLSSFLEGREALMCGRREEAAGRTVGELLRPGMLIASGPDAVPYLIDSIEPASFGWNLTGLYAPGGVAQITGHDRWWLIGWVAQEYAPAPLGAILRPSERFTYDCPARDCMFVVISEMAFAARRSGQLVMFS